MADEDRQPPQSYDTVAPAGVGTASSNVMSPRAWQDLYLSGDQGLLDVAMEEMRSDLLYEFMQSIPPADVIASWPDVDGTSLTCSTYPVMSIKTTWDPSHLSITTCPKPSPPKTSKPWKRGIKNNVPITWCLISNNSCWTIANPMCSS